MSPNTSTQEQRTEGGAHDVVDTITPERVLLRGRSELHSKVHRVTLSFTSPVKNQNLRMTGPVYNNKLGVRSGICV